MILPGMPLFADDVDARSHKGLLPDACFHRTVARGGAVKRTKYFFGARLGSGAVVALCLRGRDGGG